MRIVGMMSGTSLDGLSVGYFEVSLDKALHSSFLKGRTFAFERGMREEIRQIAQSDKVPISLVSKVHNKLGWHASECLEKFLAQSRSLGKPELVGYHGQTVHHAPRGKNHLTRTFQIGDPSPICLALGVPVVSDFRSMDAAAGGQGAPLVSVVDYLKYRNPSVGRIVLNLGGIANFTVLPRGCKLEDVIAFDVGPGNILIDSVIKRLTRGNQLFDRAGRIAARGKTSSRLFKALLRWDNYRTIPYPKTTGRERYGPKLAEKILALASKKRMRQEDVIATVGEYTFYMINYHLQVLARRGFGNKIDELIIGGGGTKNKFLMKRLERNSPGFKVTTHQKYGITPEFWECHAFAVLAYLSFRGYYGNVPSATGASQAVRLGRINFPKGKKLV